MAADQPEAVVDDAQPHAAPGEAAGMERRHVDLRHLRVRPAVVDRGGLGSRDRADRPKRHGSAASGDAGTSRILETSATGAMRSTNGNSASSGQPLAGGTDRDAVEPARHGDDREPTALERVGDRRDGPEDHGSRRAARPAHARGARGCARSATRAARPSAKASGPRGRARPCRSGRATRFAPGRRAGDRRGDAGRAWRKRLGEARRRRRSVRTRPRSGSTALSPEPARDTRRHVDA